MPAGVVLTRHVGQARKYTGRVGGYVFWVIGDSRRVEIHRRGLHLVRLDRVVRHVLGWCRGEPIASEQVTRTCNNWRLIKDCKRLVNDWSWSEGSVRGRQPQSSLGP